MITNDKGRCNRFQDFCGDIAKTEKSGGNLQQMSKSGEECHSPEFAWSIALHKMIEKEHTRWHLNVSLRKNKWQDEAQNLQFPKKVPSLLCKKVKKFP